MDKRFFLALLLSGAVIVGLPLVLRQPAPPTPVASDSAQVSQPANAAAAVQPPGVSSAAGTSPAPVTQLTVTVAAETLTIGNEVATYRYSSKGAVLVSADLPGYRKLAVGDGNVRLAHGREAMLGYRIIAGGDTIRFANVDFTSRRDSVDGRPRLTYTGATGTARLTVSYTLGAGDYVTDVRVRADGVPQPAYLLVDLPTGFESQEADSTDDYRHLAYAMRRTTGGAERIDFRKPDPGELIFERGPFTWAVAKSKFFVIGVLAKDSSFVFEEVRVTGAIRTNKLANRAEGSVVAKLPAEGVSFELFAGPQKWERLVEMGREFENVNPYGGWISGIVQPFATLVMQLLLWMKGTLGVSYGWILIIFGVTIRLLMWPLNSRMMRSSVAMQRVAPKIQAAQAEAKRKYPDDPMKQQQAVMKVYQDEGVSPFASLSGCLPMLLPMPILFALFFVFQNTIEFRGVPFLWLADISLKDPYYILPLLMGASMFVLSWVGMRNVPPNPQTRMMAWMMPIVMTVVLVNFASGLNLYYAVQNLAALPQQWLISNEKAKAAAGGAAKGEVKGAAVVDGGGGRKRA